MFTPKPKDMPEGTGRVASNLRSLRKMIKRLTPTGAGVSHGPMGTSYMIPRGRGGGGGASNVPSWR